MAPSKYKEERDQVVEKLQAIYQRINNQELEDDTLRRDISYILDAEVRQFADLRDAEVWEEGLQAGLSVKDPETEPAPPNPYRKTA